MKTGISVALTAHYQQATTTLATLWTITRHDAVVFRFTDHDVKIVFGGHTFVPTSTYDMGSVATQASMAVDDVTLIGLLAIDAITAKDIEAGLWDGAKIEISEVNYADLTMGENVLRFGELGEIQRNGPQFTAELRGLMQTLQNGIGRVVIASCDADLGDARCKVNLEALRVGGTVTAAPSTRAFTASAMAQAVNYFRYGVITWVTGLNAGLLMEIKAFAVGGVFKLQLDMPNAIQIGDTFTVVPGCDKGGRLGDCVLKFNNYVNFRGFEDIPGSDKILLVGGQ